jgi:hypothetical protein
MGSPPGWYRLIKAAQFLQVPPWVLAEKPHAWVNMAEAAQAAEHHAALMRQKNPTR